MTTRRRRCWLLGLGIILSCVLLVLSFRTLDFENIGAQIAEVNPLAFLIFAVLRLLNFALPTLRSRILFAPLSKTLGLGTLFKSVLMAFAVNNVIPFRAGEVARVGYLARRGSIAPTTCIAVVAFERLLDMLALLLVLAFTVPAMAIDLPVTQSFYILTGVVLVAIAGAVLVSRRPGLFVAICRGVAGLAGASVRRAVEARARTFAEGLSALSSVPALLGVVFTSLGFWMVAALILYTWMWAFDMVLPWYAPIVVLAFLSFGLAIPSAPGNLGTYHWLVIQALATVGVSQADAAPYAFVVHAMAMVPFTVLAVPILLRDYRGEDGGDEGELREHDRADANDERAGA